MSEPQATANGRVVGRYVLYDELAAGGMATVHLGRLMGEIGFSRSVAVKRLHAQFARDPEFVAMFMEEAHIAARIRHPNVVPVLDVVATDNELFLVMEYIQGETLTRLTRVNRDRSRIVPMPIALAIAADMLQGLHAAHEAKDEHGKALDIVHRDVSPHNVMVGNDGVARVLDFGIAKASSSAQSTRDGEVKGKFAYMSPEQLSSVPVDRRADVFAASIVIWEMLTARRLFAANDPAAIVGKVLNGKIQKPSDCVGGIPAVLDTIVMRGLEREMDRRYATAADMARAIEACGLPIARPTEVGAWVNRIAGDVLKRRARRLAEIESTGTGPFPRAATSSQQLPTDVTGSQSASGMRPRSYGDNVDASGPYYPADASSSMQAPVVVPQRRSRMGMVLIAFFAVALGVGGFFVWRAGGVRPAMEKISRFTHPTPVGSSYHAATAASAADIAGAALQNDPNVIASPSSMPTTGAIKGVPRRGGLVAQSGADPKLTRNVPLGAAGNGSGDLGDAIKNASGGGTGLGQTATTAAAPTGNVPQHPSLGSVQIAIAAVLPTAKGCLAVGDPVSHANVTFQSNGSVSAVSVTGFAAGKSSEGCVKLALSKASISPFADPTYVVPVSIRP